MRERTVLRMPAFRSAGFAAALALVALAEPVLAMPETGSDTVKGLYDTLLNTMKNAHILRQSGRFAHLEPVLRLILGRAERRATPADGGELRALHFGDLRRTLRQL